MPTTPAIRAFAKAHKMLYRISGGRLGKTLRGGKVVFLTTTGRKSGEPRTWPLVAVPHGDDWLVIGSNGGTDRDPSWVLNLRADPHVSLRIDDTTTPMLAREATGAERDQLWADVIAQQPVFATYEQKTDRAIPVVVLTPTH